MLPQRDGWSVIESARAEGIGTPIVVVSARGTEHDRVHALEIGADDYLVKPFSMAELVARVNAAARRGVRAPEPTRGEPIEVEELRIDPREVQAYVDGESCRADADRVPAPLPARARPGSRRHARRAAPEALGPPRVAPRPHRRRVRPAAAREGRPARAAPHLHPDPLRRRLQARAVAKLKALRRRTRREIAASPRPQAQREQRDAGATSTAPARRPGPTRSWRKTAASTAAMTTLVSRTAETEGADARRSASSTSR